jgi:hypothetical protein
MPQGVSAVVLAPKNVVQAQKHFNLCLLFCAIIYDTVEVIPKIFFRWLLRAAGRLSRICASAPVAPAKILLAGVPARHATRLGAGAALAKET